MAEERIRQYVIVHTSKTVSGVEVPGRIYWLDGRCFEVDSVVYIKPLPKSQDGATCFTVVVNNRRTFIYKDYRGWYVYPKEKITKESLAEMEKARVARSLGMNRAESQKGE